MVLVHWSLNGQLFSTAVVGEKVIDFKRAIFGEILTFPDASKIRVSLGVNVLNNNDDRIPVTDDENRLDVFDLRGLSYFLSTYNLFSRKVDPHIFRNHLHLVFFSYRFTHHPDSHNILQRHLVHLIYSYHISPHLIYPYHISPRLLYSIKLNCSSTQLTISR